jgi:hypothetical protein
METPWMRKLIPIAVILAAGCSTVGPVTRRPGGNVVLPKHSGTGTSILEAVLCSSRKRDSIPRVTGEQPGSSTTIVTGCDDPLKIKPPR